MVDLVIYIDCQTCVWARQTRAPFHRAGCELDRVALNAAASAVSTTEWHLVRLTQLGMRSAGWWFFEGFSFLTFCPKIPKNTNLTERNAKHVKSMSLNPSLFGLDGDSPFFFFWRGSEPWISRCSTWAAGQGPLDFPCLREKKHQSHQPGSKACDFGAQNLN